MLCTIFVFGLWTLSAALIDIENTGWHKIEYSEKYIEFKLLKKSNFQKFNEPQPLVLCLPVSTIVSSVEKFCGQGYFSLVLFYEPETMNESFFLRDDGYLFYKDLHHLFSQFSHFLKFGKNRLKFGIEKLPKHTTLRLINVVNAVFSDETTATPPPSTISTTIRDVENVSTVSPDIEVDENTVTVEATPRKASDTFMWEILIIVICVPLIVGILAIFLFCVLKKAGAVVEKPATPRIVLTRTTGSSKSSQLQVEQKEESPGASPFSADIAVSPGTGSTIKSEKQENQNLPIPTAITVE